MRSDDTVVLCRCGETKGARCPLYASGATLEAIYRAHVRQEADGCWRWTGKLDDKGYGCLSHQGRRIRAHQFSWQLHYGQSSKGREVCHSCDTPPCSNPQHLFLGTHAENMRDAMKKGRLWRIRGEHVIGEACPTAKLTEADIPVVKELHRQGHSTRAIGRRYGVAHHQIRRILSGAAWRHVG